ncbi:carboxyltransferase domain-containing protein [Microbacterium sp. NPDC096154]|uniref:5-oxoprolinase subunit B family protein n=1 Tax=Microbacterium sp. NPDC096154 TaxID=3155549 RepID=UPI003326A5B5
MADIYKTLQGGARLSFGGDEFVFVELSEDMRIPQALAIQALTQRIAALDVAGVIDVCPAHASYMIRFDSELVDLDGLLALLDDMHAQASGEASASIETSIIDVPVYYDDPWTRETLMKFRDRHQDPDSTDIDYVARINGYAGADELAAAHAEHPFLVTFPNFVPGNAESVQLVPRERQIEAPKYKRPRTETPSRAVGHGGAFTNVYPSFGAGGVQLIGRTPIDIVDMDQARPDFAESPVLFTAGALLAFRRIDGDEYVDIRRRVEAGEYRVRRAPVVFSVARHLDDWHGYNRELKEALR